LGRAGIEQLIPDEKQRNCQSYVYLQGAKCELFLTEFFTMSYPILVFSLWTEPKNLFGSPKTFKKPQKT
jgi:hypothetical protein